MFTRAGRHSHGDSLVNAKLTLAARLVEYDLRRIPFVPGRHRRWGRSIVLRLCLDRDGIPDKDRLIAEIAPDLPDYVLHRHQSMADHYARALDQKHLGDRRINRLVAWLQRRACPNSLGIMRVVTRLLRPILWGLGRIVHRREAAPQARLGERFGRATQQRPRSRIIWLHAASLGEVKKLHGLLTELSNHTDITPLVTTYTVSSAQWMGATFPDVIHQFAPLDTACYVDRFLNHWQPECLVVVENELWPEMILDTARRGVRLVQIGVRPSSSRRKYSNVVGYLMTHFNLVTCVNDAIRREFIEIGIAPERVITDRATGQAPEQLPVDADHLKKLRAQIGTRPAWVAASTHPADLAIVLGAQAKLCKENDIVAIIAPRHPRDARTIARACQSYGLAVSQRSLGDEITNQTDVYIADTFGELGTLFSLAQTVYLGGGIGDEGGHNPNEPAAFQCHILSGPHVANHEQVFADLIAAHQAEFVETPVQLASAIRSSMANNQTRQTPLPVGSVATTDRQSQTGDMAKLVLDHILGTADNPEKLTENVPTGNLV